MDESTEFLLRERALFYLRRRVRELDADVPTHDDLARRGLSYDQRRQIMGDAETKEAAARAERAAIQWAIDYLER